MLNLDPVADKRNNPNNVKLIVGFDGKLIVLSPTYGLRKASALDTVMMTMPAYRAGGFRAEV